MRCKIEIIDTVELLQFDVYYHLYKCLSFLYVVKPKNYVSGTSIDLVMLTLSWSWMFY